MKRGLLVLSALAIVGVQLARADLEKGALAPDIEAKEWLNTESGEAVSLTEYRGMIVVLFFWVNWSTRGGENILGLINLVENHDALGKGRGVIVIGLTDAEKKRIEGQLEKEKISFPVGTGSKSAEEYRLQRYPSVVIIDVEGRVAWSGWPGNDEEMVKTLRETLAANPPTRTHPQYVKIVHSKLERARAAIREEDWPEAFSAARDAYENALTGDTLKQDCQQLLDLLEAIGRDRLAAAEDQIEQKQYEEGVKSLRAVVRRFHGLEAAKTAKARLETLTKTNEKIAEVVKAMQGSAQARADLRKALDQLEAKRFGEAFTALDELQKEYSDSEEGQRAEQVLARMRQDARIMGEVREFQAERDCKRWLSESKTYMAARRWKEARERLERILDKYPETSFAKDAARELARIP
ncbi:MAG: redoxin domain-containing protein [Phycisphaerae bacterium]